MRHLPCLVLCAVFASGTASAASIFTEGVIVRYDASGPDVFLPTTVAVSLSATALGAGTSSADLEAGLTLPGTVFLRPNLSSPTAAEAVANGQFFEFTLSSLAGLAYQPQTLTFSSSKGGASTPRGWVIQTSLDGFTDPLASAEVSEVQPGMQSFTVALSALGIISDDLTIRIYGYSPGEGEGLYFDDIEIQGLLETIINPVFRPELLLGAATSVIHSGRQFHREIERQSLGRVIPQGDCFQAWGGTGIDWFGGGSGESLVTTAGFAFLLPHGLVGQVAMASEATRGAPIDADTGRVGFSIDNGRSSGFQWLAYAGGFFSEFESSRSGDFALGTGLMHLETSGRGIETAASAAWGMHHGSISWGPVASVEYLRLEVDAAQFAGGIVPARVGLDDSDSLRTLIGVRAKHDPLRFGIEPFASIHFATEWSGADGGSLTTTVGQRAVANSNGRGTSLVMDAGASIPLWEGGSAWAGYLGELPLSGNGTESHGLRLGIGAFF